ncbi:MAG: inositol monophosphatase [Gammaproteobacteria bacterium TMED112]|nr:MAG: inositol monophosphatase [Gammaproteobacteria bacterium TMED112]|tara:strand:- start:10574 stop:11293 length:720 start_codon:yes stop_codon:yes gene_type:complete
MNLVKLGSIAKKTAKKAGTFLLKQKSEKKIIESQKGRDIKLELDRKTEELIREELAATKIKVQGEEIATQIDEKLRWVVDPIDGTANYFRGLNQCCVSIALMDEDECLIGVIYDFNSNECYEAIKNHGAKLNNVRIEVSTIKEKDKASLTTGFPASESVTSSMEFLEDLKGWKKIRMFGSAALSCAYVASGKCDFYAEKGVYLWDFAAGICLVEEAGGKVEFSLIDSDRYSVKISNGKL